MLFSHHFVFFLITIDFHLTLHLALGLVGMHSTAASMKALVKSLYLSFRVCVSDFLKSIQSVSYSYSTFIGK